MVLILALSPETGHIQLGTRRFPMVRKIPTVKLEHKKTGRRLILNQFDYAEDIAKYADWKIVGQKGGDATKADLDFALAQSNVERERVRSAEREARFHDNQRKFEERRIETPIVTEAAEVEIVEEEKPELKDWKEMPWRDACFYLQELTGTYPRSKVQASRLWDEYLAKNGN